MTQIIVAPGKQVVKDAAGNVMIKDNLIKFGASGCAFGVCANVQTADNALTCDSEGNCMLKDKLANNSLTCDSEGNYMLKDKLLSFGGSYKGNSVSVSTADNALTCDSEGNCMLKDKLWKMPKVAVGGSYGGMSGSISTADNALTCDAAGDCMLGKPVKKTPAEVQQVLKAKGKCPMNYDWNKIAGGWRCSGGTHFMTDAQVAAM